jgi:hypothetical protein
MTNPFRVCENEIAKAVQQYLFDAGGEATISQIRKALPNYIELNDNDRQPSPSRPGEEIWEQQVRNLVCHRQSHGNAVKTGKLKYKPRRLALADTPQGSLFG